MRLTLALAAAVGVGVVGALVLGEYPFRGVTVLAAGVLFGLFIAEAALAVNRAVSPSLGIGCAVVGLGAMTWSGWISSGRALSFLGPAGWTAVALTGVVAGARTSGLFTRLSFRRGSGSHPEAPAPAAPSDERPA
jgi:hypothetical protein